MDVKLDSLIEKLRTEGVEEAQEASRKMIEQAREEADGIVAEARKEADRITAEATAEAARLQENGELALKQAARDSELLLKNRITDIFDRVFKHKVSELLTPETMKEIVLRITDQWQSGSSAEITLSEAETKQLEDLLFTGVGEELKDSVFIRASKDITHGFRIGMKGDSVYYDFTDESITEALMAFLQPRLKSILDGRDG
jgi:V/A-type H+-transporting ATPase subunit E